MKARYLNTLVPKTAVLEVTYECNHQCIFCSSPWYSPRKDYLQREELSISDWKKCIDKIIRFGVQDVAFTGGESLLKPGLAELVQYVSLKKVKIPKFTRTGKVHGFKFQNPKVTVITNGEIISSYWVDLFKKYRLTVVVSLPGLNTFTEHTGGGNYKNALHSIKQYARAGLDVVVAICVTRKNLPELFETISVGFLHGAKQLLLNRFLPGGRGLGYPDLCLTQPQVTEMLDTAEQVCTAANTHGSVGTELPQCILTQKYKMVEVGTLCSGGVDFFAIDPSGYVRPCNHSAVRLGKYTDITSSIATKYWQRFKTKCFLPTECTGCIKSTECDGGCREAARLVNGKLNSIDPIFNIVNC